MTSRESQSKLAALLGRDQNRSYNTGTHREMDFPGKIERGTDTEN